MREHELGHLDDREAEARVADKWQVLQGERDANRKGLLLEELMELLFRSVHGFQVFPPRRRSEDEEIDLVIRIDSSDPLWAREAPYILVECKNWSRPVSADAFDRFRNKIKRRYGRATLGLFVAPGGFTEGFHTTRSTERKGKILVVCIGPAELAALVAASDRNAELKRLHAQAIIDANGSH
ncbi:MAG TPA: restriction endonuclease [Haliangium sp.]|nr:restriction endonuclease [Haliangium sp.]